MNDPYLVMHDLLNAAASLKVAAERMERWLKENDFPTGRADSLRAQAIDLEESAQQFVASVRAGKEKP